MSIPCPICHASSVVPWGNRSGYAIHQCRACSHIFAGVKDVNFAEMDAGTFRSHITSNRMNDDEAYYRHLCKNEAPGKHTFRTAQIILTQIKRHPFPPGGQWLDIGSGSGFLLGAAAALGWDVTGVEPGGWGQIAAHEKNVRVVQGLLQDDTFPFQFDAISATDVIEHQVDPYEIMNLIRHYLKPEGRAFISLPWVESLQGWLFKERWEMVTPPTHCHFFTRKSFGELLSNAALELEGVVQFNSSTVPYVERFDSINRLCMSLIDRLGMGDQVVLAIKHQRP